MAPDLEKQAKEAFVDDNFELAAELYSQALDIDPKNADLFADRAQANIKLGNFTEAVADADNAIELEPSMAKAFLRKGTACIKLEEYETAKAALELGVALAPGDSRFTKLIKECDEYIAGDTRDMAKNTLPNPPASPISPPSSTRSKSAQDSCSVLSTSSQAPESVPSKPKYRHDYYNSSSEVVITIFAKGIPADKVSADFGEQILRIVIDVAGEETFHFQRRLFGKIIPENCRYHVLPSKIEIHLAKAEAVTWPTLEYTEKKIPAPKVPAAQTSNRPYPSSKSKIDWDNIVAEVKQEEKDEKLEGDAALNKLFQDIYRDADDDTRRAMRKSFVESNGTVLSTNWKEVGSKAVEGSPPEGMEVKKWEY